MKKTKKFTKRILCMTLVLATMSTLSVSVFAKSYNYDKYDMLNTVQVGDIIYENNGNMGITGHIAIVEEIKINPVTNEQYITVIEAVSNSGVVRNVIDDDRYDNSDDTVLRVKGATQEQKEGAVDFAVQCLDAGYKIDFAKDTSVNEKDWYCSELAWAAYKSQGIDIETTKFWNEPGITPHDIYLSPKVEAIDITKD